MRFVRLYRETYGYETSMQIIVMINLNFQVIEMLAITNDVKMRPPKLYVLIIYSQTRSYLWYKDCDEKKLSLVFFISPRLQEKVSLLQICF